MRENKTKPKKKQLNHDQDEQGTSALGVRGSFTTRISFPRKQHLDSENLLKFEGKKSNSTYSKDSESGTSCTRLNGVQSGSPEF